MNLEAESSDVGEGFKARVQIFDLDGGFITTWGSKGKGEGQFDSPDGIAVDAQGRIIIFDDFGQRVQVFA